MVKINAFSETVNIFIKREQLDLSGFQKSKNFSLSPEYATDIILG
jgi:hypothetical protein